MNEPTKPDYGEPWRKWSELGPVVDKSGNRLALLKRHKDRMLACAGMADPAAELAAMREAIKEAHAALTTCKTYNYSDGTIWRQTHSYPKVEAALAKLQRFTLLVLCGGLLTACSSVSDLPPSILPPAELQTTPGKWWSFWAGLWTGRGTTPAPAGSGWIQHQPGAPMPVAPTDRVEVLFESGLTGGPYPAYGFGWGSFPDDPGAVRIIGWRHYP